MDIRKQMNNNMKKYRAAISDTDILIHLYKADALSVLNLIFEEIIIPQYILDKELKKIAGNDYDSIVNIISAKGSIFKVIDREKDFIFNKLAIPIINEYKIIVGKGESECAGYASASGIPIIISNNHTEFKYFEEEYIMLNYFNILSICRYFKIITPDKAIELYDSVNSLMKYPSSITFQRRYNESLKRFKECGWDEYLGIT